MTAVPHRIQALMLLLAGALVIHLFMLSDVGAPQAEEHAGTDAATVGVGGMHTDLEAPSSDGEPHATGHAMAVACMAVLAAGGMILGLERASAQRDALPVDRTWAPTSMVRVPDLWPPPRDESSRIDGGVLLLI